MTTANLLAASLSYWTRSKISSQHPLDFYASVIKPNYPATHTHPAALLNVAMKRYANSWTRNAADFDARSLVWSLGKFDSPTVMKALSMHHEISTNLSPDVVSKLTMSLASLEQALLTQDPMMPQHLRASHQLLISYPETVHLLDDDEISRLITAAQIHTKIEIVKLNTPKTAGRKKITADDL